MIIVLLSREGCRVDTQVTRFGSLRLCHWLAILAVSNHLLKGVGFFDADGQGTPMSDN